jgi:predicted methyltransferase
MYKTAITLALAIAACPLAAAVAEARVSHSIAAAVADPGRPKDQVSTDAIRKPAETIDFAGVKPGMIVGEFFPGGGYFTRMLSDVVGPKGHVYGLENAGWGGAVKADRAMVVDGKLANVSIEALPMGQVHFSAPLDIVWVTQNYHDLKVPEYGSVDIAGFNRAVFAALKPGGVYFVLDHEAPQGGDTASIAKLHRIEKAQVIREVIAAGFRLDAEGNFLRNPADDHSLPIFDKAIQGHTDQYALRFVKPLAQ